MDNVKRYAHIKVLFPKGRKKQVFDTIKKEHKKVPSGFVRAAVADYMLMQDNSPETFGVVVENDGYGNVFEKGELANVKKYAERLMPNARWTDEEERKKHRNEYLNKHQTDCYDVYVFSTSDMKEDIKKHSERCDMTMSLYILRALDWYMHVKKSSPDQNGLHNL